MTYTYTIKTLKGRSTGEEVIKFNDPFKRVCKKKTNAKKRKSKAFVVPEILRVKVSIVTSSRSERRYAYTNALEMCLKKKVYFLVE